MADQVVDQRSAAPVRQLAGLVSGYHGTRLAGFSPGEHLGLPAPGLEVIVSLGEPIRLAAMPDGSQPPRSFSALAAGLQTSPAVIVHDGSAYDMSVGLTPAGVRSLLGVPAAGLAGAVVCLENLVGRFAGELVERLVAAPDWDARFALLDRTLTARARPITLDPTLGYVWRRIAATGGAIRIGELAAETGYSRQHLTKRFAAEFGQTPKQVARVTRFARSKRLLQDAAVARRTIRLAEVAARCGYYDQAHLAQDWRELAGCPPSIWLSTEDLPFVQAEPDRR